MGRYLLSERSEETLKGCHRPEGQNSQPRGPASESRPRKASLCPPLPPFPLPPFRPPALVPLGPHITCWFPQGFVCLGSSPPGLSRVPRLTPPSRPGPRPLPAPTPGSKAAASRGRRAAPNRPGEPRENPGGSQRSSPARGARSRPGARRAPAACAPRAAGSNPAHGHGGGGRRGPR